MDDFSYSKDKDNKKERFGLSCFKLNVFEKSGYKY